MLEVLNALGAMRDELVIVGGWVPDLLYPSSNHMGSFDVDLAVSPKAIGRDAYSSIRERLTQAGYTMQESPTRFFKHLPGSDSVGPVWAGRAAVSAGEDSIQFQRAAYEDAAELFRRLDGI